MYGLTVNLIVSLLGHLSNIDEIPTQKFVFPVTPLYTLIAQSCEMKETYWFKLVEIYFLYLPNSKIFKVLQ